MLVSGARSFAFGILAVAREYALVAQAGVPAAVSCAYSSGAVECWDMHGCPSSGAVCVLIHRYRSAQPMPVVGPGCCCTVCRG